MGGACRETYRLTVNPSVLLRRRTWRYNKALLLKDNLAWLVCAIRGHKAYNTSLRDEKPEHACTFCGRWLPKLDPTDWTPPLVSGRGPFNDPSVLAKVPGVRADKEQP
jgi:hypothetical protein